MLTSYLDTKFPRNRRVPLGSLVQPVKTGALIPKGTLTLTASGDRRLRLKILEQDTPQNWLTEPLAITPFATTHKVTANYLLWYLSQNSVARYLVEHASGAILVRVPRKFLYAVPTPLPTRITRVRPNNEFTAVSVNNRFSRLIADLHNDYLLNLAHKRYRTAAVLSGAICEVILYQLLIEHGVNPTLIKDDHSLGLKKLLDYIRILKLDQVNGFPISQLVQTQKNRNAVIHAGLLINNEQNIQLKDLEVFDPITRYFGL